MEGVKINGHASLTGGFEESKPRFVYDPRETHSERSISIFQAKIVTGQELEASSIRVDATRLYTDDDGTLSREFGSALLLLTEMEASLESASESLREGDPIAADDSSYAIKTALPELFCCRSLGEGFATIVAGLIGVFSNLRGAPLNSEQLRCIASIISELRRGPRISVVRADELMERLESVSLDPEPKPFRDLLSQGLDDFQMSTDDET